MKNGWAWCGVAACVVVLVVLFNGCAESYDIIVINTTAETVSVQMDADIPLTVKPNSYALGQRGVRDLSRGYDFELYSEDGRQLGSINVPSSMVSKNSPYAKTYVLTIVATDLMTVEESIAFEQARDSEFVVIAMVELESEDRVVRLFEENEIRMAGHKTLNRFKITVMRRDRLRAMEHLEQDAKENGYELY